MAIRLAELVVALLATSLFSFQFMAIAAHRSKFNVAGARACLAGAPTWSETERCVRQLGGNNAAVMISGSALVVIGGTLLFAILPWLIKKRRRLRRPADDFAPAVASVDTMRKEAGIRRAPSYLVAVLRGSRAGVTFGAVRSRYLALPSGLVLQQSRDPTAFRAVVLHELAHIRNGDIPITYFAVSIWWAFLGLAVAPYTAIAALDGGDLVWQSTWRLGVLLVVTWLLRASVLRTREHYADIRAKSWESDAAGIEAALSSMGKERFRLGRIWSLHPDPKRRLDAVTDPTSVYNSVPADAFVAGFVGMLGFGSILGLLMAIGPAEGQDRSVAAFVLSPIVAGTIGVSVWRSGVLAARPTRDMLRAFAAGPALVAGILAADRVSLPSALGIAGADRGALSGLDAPDLVLVAVGLGALMVWVFSSARLRGTHQGHVATRPVVVAGLASVAIAMAAVFNAVPYLQNREALQAAVDADVLTSFASISERFWVGPRWLWSLNGPVVLPLALSKLTLAAVIVLCVFPLSTRRYRWRWGRRFRDSTAPQLVEPLAAAVTGLLAAAGYLVFSFCGSSCVE